VSVVFPLVIYFLIPAVGFGLYESLCSRMNALNTPDPPRLALAILFGTYGGWLLVVLTEMFWFWSGLASLGTIYLIAVAPIVLGLLAVQLYPKRTLSRFHKLAFVASVGYVAIPLMAIACAFVVGRK
jgi:hypothetical protein